MGIDGISLSALVIELHKKLSGGRIDKIYQVDKTTLIMWIRQMQEDYCLIISANPENPGIYITDKAPENPAVPPAFCMLLRKHFEEGRIARIYQHSLDRIISIEIDIREERGTIATKALIIEIMGKRSNIIFAQNDTIVDAIKRVGVNISRFRQIMPGLKYQLPPGQQRLNILSISTEDFLNVLQSQNNCLLSKAIINTAAGIGSVIASEIIWRAGLPTNIEVDSMDEASFLSVGKSIETIKSTLCTGSIEPNIVLDKYARLIAVSAIKLEHLASQDNDIRVFSTMNEVMEFINKQCQEPIAPPDKVIIAKLVESLIARLTRKRKMLNNELEEAKKADVARKYGDLLMTNLYKIPERANQIIIEDLYCENRPNITIELDPLRTPVENVQAYYNKYAKLKRASEMLLEQLDYCNSEIDYLEGILVSINNAESSIEINEIRQELISQSYIKETRKKRMKVGTKSQPLKVITPEGVTILIGKNNQQNDYVTFKQAGPDDLWLHTKNIPGSHVIMHINQEHPLESDLLVAAQLAAYFSKAKNSANVPVDYTRRRYVKKPAGAKPGFVIYTNQKTINVTPVEEFINSLIGKE
ncbi:MAG: fibronectin/fibrinogen-binding protein [Veillonellaceae bacterium]|nr:fibronectin/fibrinogen-binding protein [Veillonellaceae bacterium]